MAALGGRFSTELGIDVDAGPAEVERWFLAATLFGNRIPARIAIRTHRVFADAGLVRIGQARHVGWDALVALLDQGGYTRYDFRTATRLQALSETVDERYASDVDAIGRRATSPEALADALDALPGWGPVTVRLFLRELRGVWTHADPPLDERAAEAAHHLGLLGDGHGPGALARLRAVARDAHVDLRDLESALVRLALAHRHGFASCPGGPSCPHLAG